MLVVEKKRRDFYSRFDFIDSILTYEDLDSAVTLLNSSDVIVPHGSLIEYLGIERASKLKSKSIFGTRNLFSWESDQKKKMSLLKMAGVKIPEQFEDPEDVDRRVIVKLPGAKGGKGYFVAESKGKVKEGLAEVMRKGLIKDPSEALIQEYVIGVPMYFQFFRSVVKDRIEITGIDVRYETNVDSLRRLVDPKGVEPSFVVVGNIPLVARESLLPNAFAYAESFVRVVDDLVRPKMIGPFCLETVVTDELDIVTFEFSGRIVAGTNLYIDGSPYSWLYWREPMSVGRRIARELREAKEKGKLEEVLT
ncbi:5-formaminoimidazole-4-carboxamide-1-(beta)-D-ribofuranosyl 5'-monophosphate synthetase [Sulfodiicoccus acidiphilus]|uniref:5-formaminoimidazole-4-carboxamide-1-(Beta)-D-ribofuranosyl 5'-monophosphate synthetase n=2 Tax=Sulfodiicoccus acidiphilus TaxID=1670455 RepID=A0A348B0C3_9CREN|nr:5-formaminoimidazole-4-carboxamide-1-(beta)-D-ribofuranosyl 5'-monophosphate synthetase [Sulfodiicoccus acidiphilus]GGT87007.1 5-formaminoimidazole-4-carboxamide-1-(beta)-D-ribofuranosyl 5'-monophosphate synthetase [Sulfodiicoccus acidiphilus]